MTAKQMPKIDLDKLSEILTTDEFELVKGIVSTRGKSNGCLRASKPKVERHQIGIEHFDFEDGTSYDRPIYGPDEKQGKTAFVWRHVAFSISPHRQHQCMPTMDFCDLPKLDSWDGRRALEKELMDLADKVVKTVDVSEWHGVQRWGQALGRIGTPQVAQDGAIIYR